jgi:hypothetical protein
MKLQGKRKVVPSKASPACGCGSAVAKPAAPRDRMAQPFVVGEIETSAGPVPRVATDLSAADHWGTFKARWGMGRMDYSVPPGLYAVGTPVKDASVLVSANYKMSFDALRSELTGRDLWILVLDTKGINVWCAAGKGTFGTEELVRRIKETQLEQVVAHRRVILPQLGAPGVAAHTVRELSGFKVTYGPVLSTDLPRFLDDGPTPDMRRKRFPMGERVALIPVELVEALKTIGLVIPLLVLLSGIGAAGSYGSNLAHSGITAAVALFAAVLGGSILTPVLLPWLPGSAFSLKGLWIGLGTAAMLIFWRRADIGSTGLSMELIAWAVIVPALTAFLAMNFTGASTYTSPSGVKKEMRYAVPAQIAASASGLILWVAARFVR